MTEAISFVGTKGGAFTTTTAAAYALRLPTTDTARALFLDATGTGDGAAVFGLGAEPRKGAVITVAPNLDLLAIDPGDVIGAVKRAEVASYATVVIDGGAFPNHAPNAVNADRFYLVTDASYLSFRRATAADLTHCTGVIVVEIPGRALGAREVADVLGLPVATRIPWRDAVARAVDAGVLAHRVPEVLARAVVPIGGATSTRDPGAIPVDLSNA